MKLSDELKTYRTELRKLLEQEFEPLVDERDQRPMTKAEALEYVRTLGQIGIGPAGEGGLSAFHDPLDYVVISEEISRVWPSLNMLLTGCIPVDFLAWSSDETREAYADRIESGELIGALAVTEPGSGSDTANPDTTATKDGGEYVINGEKTWISNATIADMAVVVAHNEETDERDFFVVDQKTSGFETTELDKLGWKGSPTGQMIFNECRVPEGNHSLNIMGRFLENAPERAQELMDDGLLGRDKPLNAIFAFLRTVMGAMATGISKASLEAAKEYATNRQTAGEPIAQHQLIQEKLYEIKAATETSRQLVYHAAQLLDENDPETRKMTSLAKGHATEKCLETASNAVQIYGGNGVSTDYPVERYLRDARSMTIPDGTTEIQKLIVAYEMTDLSAY